MSSSHRGDWNAGLCDPGEGCDCPRSCFLGCDQFGRTRYRLMQLDRRQDPLDLSGYKVCNSSCWGYFCLCIAGLYIGSGIYTGKQTKRIRKTYNIEGSYCDDVAKGIFCQPCSLIQNDLEIRRRQQASNKNNIELAAGLRPPMPLGEENYRPIFAIPNTEGYRREPYMTTENIAIHPDPGRELHYHPGVNGSGGGFQAVPLYPTEGEIREHEGRWKELGSLPDIPHVASPLEDIDRRPHLLTPISEQDSFDDTRLQQLRENVPHFPQVQNWLRSMSPLAGEKTTAKRTVPVASPGNSLSIVPPQGRTYPGASPSSDKIMKKRLKTPRRLSSKSSKLGSKRKITEDEPPEQTSEISVTTNPLETGSPGTAGLVEDLVEVKRTPKHNLSTDVLIASPPESQRQHSLRADVLIASPSESQHLQSLQDDTVVSNFSGSHRRHSVLADSQIPTAHPSPAPEDADELVQVHPFTDRAHSLADKTVTADETSVHQHSLDSDGVLSIEEEHELPKSEGEPEGHEIQQNLVAAQPRVFDSDTRVSTPRRDIHVMTPPSRNLRSHGIHLDERVPTAELVRLNLEHDIIQDSRGGTSSTASKQYDMENDAKFDSPASYQPRLHSIRRDAQVSEPGSQPKGHRVQVGDANSSGSGGRKSSERAYQLLESFLERDRKPANKGSASSSPRFGRTSRNSEKGLGKHEAERTPNT